MYFQGVSDSGDGSECQVVLGPDYSAQLTWLHSDPSGKRGLRYVLGLKRMLQKASDVEAQAILDIENS